MKVMKIERQILNLNKILFVACDKTLSKIKRRVLAIRFIQLFRKIDQQKLADMAQLQRNQKVRHLLSMIEQGGAAKKQAMAEIMAAA